MLSFRSLFGSSARCSPLEQTLRKITFGDAARVYETTLDPDLRVPSSISMTILTMAHNFSSGLLKMEGGLGKKIGTLNHQSSYDAIVFETAAYAHFWSMKDNLLADVYYLNESDDDGEKVLEHSGKSRHADLITAASISDRFIAQYTTFDLPDRFFVNRAMNYCRSSDTCIDIAELNSRFEHKLSCSLLAGKPVQQKQRELDLSLDLALKSRISIFQTNSLPALSDIVGELFKGSEQA